MLKEPTRAGKPGTIKAAEAVAGVVVVAGEDEVDLAVAAVWPDRMKRRAHKYRASGKRQTKDLGQTTTAETSGHGRWLGVGCRDD